MTSIMETCRTIAVVGMSRKPHRAGFYVPEYLQSCGYEIIPVNPYLNKPVLGKEPYDNLEDLPEAPDLVLIFQRSENVPPFVDSAIAVGARAVWMQLGIENEEAAQKAWQAGLQVVQNACMLVEHRRWTNQRRTV